MNDDESISHQEKWKNTMVIPICVCITFIIVHLINFMIITIEFTLVQRKFGKYCSVSMIPRGRSKKKYAASRLFLFQNGG